MRFYRGTSRFSHRRFQKSSIVFWRKVMAVSIFRGFQTAAISAGIPMMNVRNVSNRAKKNAIALCGTKSPRGKCNGSLRVNRTDEIESVSSAFFVSGAGRRIRIHRIGSLAENERLGHSFSSRCRFPAANRNFAVAKFRSACPPCSLVNEGEARFALPFFASEATKGVRSRNVKSHPQGCDFTNGLLTCQGRDSNPRPWPYESPALPLSYPDVQCHY